MDPFSLAGEIAKGGFGYVLFLFAIGFTLWREKVNYDEKKELRLQITIVNDKRIQDLKDIQLASYERTKEERAFYDASTDKIKGAIDSLVGIINNMQTLLNFRKK